MSHILSQLDLQEEILRDNRQRFVLFPIGVVILIPISAAKSDDPSVNNDIKINFFMLRPL